MLRNPNYVYGEKDVQVPARLNFGEYILAQMVQVQERVAFINGTTGESITYGQIVQEAMNFAVSLAHVGVRKGQTVGICSENRQEFWGAVIGVCCTGAVFTTFNIGYLQEELKHVLDISKPEYVILSPNCYKQHGQFIKSRRHVKGVILFGDEKNKNVILYNDLAKPVISNVGNNVFVNNRLTRNIRYEEFDVADVDGQIDTLFILYSSGTTGLPKGVMLTHLNVISQCCLPIAHGPEKRALSIVPWYHVFGLVGSLVGLSQARETVFLPKFEVDLYLRTIEKYKIALAVVVPPVLVAISKNTKQYDLSSVEWISSGAAPFHKESADLVKAKFPNINGVFQGYGMTEVALTLTRFPYKDHAFGEKKIGSVGRAVDGSTIKIIDLETGKPLGPNQPGEICARGCMIMKGYVGKDRRDDFDAEGFYRTGDVGYYDNDQCFYIVDRLKELIKYKGYQGHVGKGRRDGFDAEGFYRTGDVGHYDNDQCSYVVDRLKELIKYKGYQVAPAELEAVLLKHEAVRDAGVIGIPDRNAGEVPLAFVVKQPGKNVTEEEIKEFVAGKLSSPKHLRGGVRFIDAIPKNPSGKILRKTLRQMAKAQTSKL